MDEQTYVRVERLKAENRDGQRMQVTMEKEFCFCFVQSETSQIGEFPPNNSLRTKT